jgi:MFS family permease
MPPDRDTRRGGSAAVAGAVPLRLGALFAVMYFVQGIGEPTRGMLQQPLRSMLKSWGYDTAAMAALMSLVAWPWSAKPLWGLLSDFVPIFRQRRKSYLLLASGATTAGMFLLFAMPPQPGEGSWLFWWLLLPSLGLAMGDVVVDALMVETGQPRGITGSLQSIQWTSVYLAGILAGVAGGWLAEHGLQRYGFAVCGAGGLVMFTVAWRLVDEPPAPPHRGFRSAVRAMGWTLRAPAVLAAAAFVFLLNFNPFSADVLYMHATEQLNFSEQYYGLMETVFSVGAAVGSAGYAFYCRRLPFGLLVHLSLVAAVTATLLYLLLRTEPSFAVISFLAGLTYMTAALVQMDLVARSCPPELAGTVFALMMGLINFSVLLSEYAGGWFYEILSTQTSRQAAFNIAVAIGALCTSLGWLLVPVLRRHHHTLTAAAA